MENETIQLGDFTLTTLNAGFFYLDGGALHGRVPKTIWSKNFKTNPKNQIKVSCNCLLIQNKKGEKILIDTGLGSKWEDKDTQIYGINPHFTIVDALKAQKIDVAEINFVLHSHLHFDHAGGNTYYQNKKIDFTFPNAVHYCHEGEFLAAQKAIADKASYRLDDFMPLHKTGRLKFFQSGKKVIPGIQALASPGHTDFHQCFLIKSKKEGALFLGDLCPTSHHIRIPYTMGLDLNPNQVIASKERIFNKIVDENYTVFWYHDAFRRKGKLSKNAQGRFELIR